MMKFKLPIALLAFAGVAATSAAVIAHPGPAGAQGDAFWANARWDDDDDHRQSAGSMPVPDADVVRQAGIVRVTEVERDDGHLEIEGYDATGRELEIRMDVEGRRVLSVRHDDDGDD